MGKYRAVFVEDWWRLQNVQTNQYIKCLRQSYTLVDKPEDADGWVAKGAALMFLNAEKKLENQKEL